MLRRTSVDGGQRIEFMVESDAPVSVVGDFNSWDPERGALVRGPDEALTWATVLTPGRYAFRYLCNGDFFDDPQADAYEANGYGGYHGVLVVESPPADEAETAGHASSATPPATTPSKPPGKPRVKAAKVPGDAAPRKPRSPRKPPAAPSADT